MRNCNRCNRTLSLCGCRKTVVNRPTEVKVGGAGKDGLNNYELWLLEGHTGTLEDYLESIKGKDGSGYEERYAKNDDPDISPSIDADERTPTGWSLTPPPITTGEYIWVARAKVSVIVPSELLTNWVTFRQTGTYGEVYIPDTTDNFFDI